jgi:sulfotransferase
MSKQLIFVSGLPKAGSTLLMNLLAQNPLVHSTATSGLHEIGYIARQFNQTEEFKTIPNPKDGETLFYDYVKGGCENAFNRLTDRPVVADKCRSWVGHLDMLFAIWPDAKVLVPVRDMRGILSSFEKKWRKHPFPFTGVEKASPQNWTTVEKRAQGWLQIPPLGIAVERLSDAARRHKDKLHFVHFEALTENPAETMRGVWEYVSSMPDDTPAGWRCALNNYLVQCKEKMWEFPHDFENVEQYTKEHELGWPYGDHEIRNKVAPVKPDWNEVLGEQLSEQISKSFNWINQL